jgi:hypothetical protein
MANCTTDWTPIISIIAIQIPIIVGVLVTWLNVKIAQEKQLQCHEIIADKVDDLKSITISEIHSWPPPPPGGPPPPP